MVPAFTWMGRGEGGLLTGSLYLLWGASLPGLGDKRSMDMAVWLSRVFSYGVAGRAGFTNICN